MTLTLIVNGEEHRVPAPITVADLVDRLGLPARGLAVAVDGAVVPASEWGRAEPADGSRIEILTAVQGG